MKLRDVAKVIYFKTSNWVADHNSEVLWAGAFGLLFAGVAWFLIPPKPDPYWIYVLVDHHTEENTLKDLLSKATASQQMPMRFINNAPVEVQIDQLDDDQESTIQAEATRIANRADVLMVIGHLPSQLAETAVKTFLDARPQMPFIATVSSDDDLLVKCKGDPNCFNGDRVAPLLQLTPTNKVQGQSAVTYGTILGKRRFLIAFDNDLQNAAYTSNLVAAYKDAIDRFNQTVKDSKTVGVASAQIVGEYKMDQPPTVRALKAWKPDCILYAGAMGEGLSLLRSVADANVPAMVIFSDSTVQDKFQTGDLKTFPGTLFTNQNDAMDYNHGKNVYVDDALAIAGELIDDLQSRREDARLRFMTKVHLQTARDVRTNLVRVMDENSISHSWYKGAAPDSVYAFSNYQRFGGLFHVWQLKSASVERAEMNDVDHWHVPKTDIETPAPQQVLAASTQP